MISPISPSVAVIGAGPAGLAAAEALAGAGVAVTVYDRMPSPARKFLIAGRGGLNLTHSEDLSRFLSRYRSGAAPLTKAIEAFSPADLIAWTEGLGQETFVGSSGRVFPKAFKASPLLRAWLARLDGLGVRLAARHRWLGWAPEGRLRFEGPGGAAVDVAPSATILALGGASWPRLGSDGAWTRILGDAGIEISPLRPSNVGFTVDWSPIFRERFEGEPLKRIALSFGGRTVRGEAIVTAEGIEGGAVYALSGRLRDALDHGETVDLTIDLRPDLTAETLAARLAGGRKGQTASTVLRKAAGLSPVGIGLMREAAGAALPSDSEALARLIKAVAIRLTGVRPIERAISSAGGIPFAELDERFMLRRRPGTFVAGEMLDWEAPTGGYLLQACFATGIASATGALAWMQTSSLAQLGRGSHDP